MGLLAVLIGVSLGITLAEYLYGDIANFPANLIDRFR